MAIGEVIGLTIKGDASSAVSAFDKVSDSLEALNKQAGKLGAALDGELFGDKPQKAMGSFVGQVKKAESGIDTLRKKVQENWKDFGGGIAKAVVGAVALQKALQFTGEALEEAIARRKFDPAIQGFLDTKQAALTFVADFKKALGDAILDAIAWIDRLSDRLAGVENTRGRTGIGASGRESAKRQMMQSYGLTEKDFVVGIPGVGKYVPGGPGIPGEYVPWEETAEFRILEQGYRAQAGGIYTRKEAANINRLGMGAITGAGGLNDRQPAERNRTRRPLTSGRAPWSNLGSTFYGTGNPITGGWNQLALGGMIADQRSLMEGRAAMGGAGMDFLGGGAGGFLGANQNATSKAFGELEDQTSAIGASLAAMTGGLTAAVDAAIAGNESIGRAFLKGAAGVLKSIALQATGMAAFEAAKAWVFPAAAPLHLAAAAKMAGVAALAGVLSAGAGAAAGAGAGAGAGGYGGASTMPGGGFARAPARNDNGNEAPIHIHIHGSVIGDDQKAMALISSGIQKGIAARRIRDPNARVTRYQTRGASYELAS